MPRYVDVSGWDSFMNDMLDSRNMYDHYDNGYTDAMDRVDDWLDAHPTIDQDSLRPHGRWEESESGFLVCSECADAFIFEEWLADGKWKYCPNCGAMMDEDEVNVCRKVVKL